MRICVRSRQMFRTRADGSEAYWFTLSIPKETTVIPHATASLDLIAFSDYRAQDIPTLIAHIDSQPRAHLILYGGDDLDRFHADGRNYFEELAARSVYGLCAVAGNDDQESARGYIPGERVYDVHAHPLRLGKFAVVGLEGAPLFPRGVGDDMNRGHLLYPEPIIERLTGVWSALEEPYLIVISHVPPYGVLDSASRFGRFGARSIGSRPLRRYLDGDASRAVLCVCGHVHSHGGRNERIGSCTVVNTASHDGRYDKGRVARIAIRRGRVASVSWDHIGNCPRSPRD